MEEIIKEVAKGEISLIKSTVIQLSIPVVVKGYHVDNKYVITVYGEKKDCELLSEMFPQLKLPKYDLENFMICKCCGRAEIGIPRTDISEPSLQCPSCLSIQTV